MAGAGAACVVPAASAADVYPKLMLLEETALLAGGQGEAEHRVFLLTEVGAAELAVNRMLALALQWASGVRCAAAVPTPRKIGDTDVRKRHGTV